MEKEKNSKLIIVLVVLLIVIIGIVLVFWLKKDDLKNSKIVETISESVKKVTGKLELNGEKEIELPYNKEFEEPGYSATDEKSGDITESVEVEKEEINENEYNLVYKVEDSSGNVIEEKRHIKLIDEVAPNIELKGNKNVYLNVGQEYQDEGVNATDEKDGDLSEKVVTEGEVDTSTTGFYTLKYSVNDNSGNSATNERYVAVFEQGKVTAQDGTLGKKGVIYLTFDDGPTESSTPQILDILERKGVKATFFIINFDGSEKENLVKREHESGHTVAIHGYSHTYSAIYQSVDTYVNNITKLQEKINATIGVSPTITRFPGGSSNTVSRHYCQGIMTTLCYEMVGRGFTYFDWNVDSDDAGHAKTSDDVYRNVTSRLSKEQENVVLMHDFANNTKTIGALESIIDYGLNNGYTFEVLTPDTPMVTHTTNN